MKNLDKIIFIITMLFFAAQGATAADAIVESVLGKMNAAKSTWSGADRYDFKYADRAAIIAIPESPRADRAWILRPAFFGAFANADAELLKRGFFIVYYDLTHCYASPNAMKLADEFFKFATREFKLKDKVVLEGLSRGGACSLNWANHDTSKIACVYVDAPVCDFSVWPSAKEKKLFADFLKEWKIESIDGFKGNPIDNFEKLARSGIAVLMVAGDSDKTVPYISNGAVYAKRFFDSGGNIQTIIKKGCDHHPHGLENPEQIVNFIERNSAAQSANTLERKSENYRKFNRIYANAPMANSAKKFGELKRGRVAFLGGSITEMRGWKNLVEDELRKRFPDAEFEFIEAGISSLGTTPHAFRMSKDIPDLKNIDMLFLEGVVNDDTNGFSEIAQTRAVEGIIRRALSENPQMDIAMLAFIWDGFLEKNAAGKTPEVIANHRKVADFYKVNFIDLNAEVSERMRVKQFDWQTFGGTHPAPFGHRIYAAAIANLFDETMKDGDCAPRKIPSAPLDKFSYANAKLLPLDIAKVARGWTLEKKWRAKTSANVRERFKNIEILETRAADSELTVNFKGTAIGIYCLSGDEAGTLEYSIDGGKTRVLDTYTQWSGALYLPWLFMLDDELENKNHTLSLKMSKSKNPKSKGNACQIISFAVNAPSDI